MTTVSGSLATSVVLRTRACDSPQPRIEHTPEISSLTTIEWFHGKSNSAVGCAIVVLVPSASLLLDLSRWLRHPL
jgi:hypothetical protein